MKKIKQAVSVMLLIIVLAALSVNLAPENEVRVHSLINYCGMATAHVRHLKPPYKFTDSSVVWVYPDLVDIYAALSVLTHLKGEDDLRWIKVYTTNKLTAVNKYGFEWIGVERCEFIRVSTGDEDNYYYKFMDLNIDGHKIKGDALTLAAIYAQSSAGSIIFKTTYMQKIKYLSDKF